MKMCERHVCALGRRGHVIAPRNTRWMRTIGPDIVCARTHRTLSSAGTHQQGRGLCAMVGHIHRRSTHQHNVPKSYQREILQQLAANATCTNDQNLRKQTNKGRHHKKTKRTQPARVCVSVLPRWQPKSASTGKGHTSQLDQTSTPNENRECMERNRERCADARTLAVSIFS